MRARPTSPRSSRSPGRCVRERFGVELEHEVELLGPVSVGLTPPIRVGGGAAERAESGRVELSVAVLMRRRAAAVVLAAVACALAAGVVELGYAWLKGSSVFALRSVAVRGGTESDRVAVRDAVARAAAGRSLLALSPSRRRRRDRGRCRRSASRASIATSRTRCASASSPSAPSRSPWAPASYRSLVAASGRVLRVFDPDEAVPIAAAHLDRGTSGRSRAASMRAAPRRRRRSMRSPRGRPTSARRSRTSRSTPERGIVMRLSSGLDIDPRPAARARREAPLRRPGCCARYPTRADRAALDATPMSRRPTAPPSCREAATPATAGLGQHDEEERPQTLENR